MVTPSTALIVASVAFFLLMVAVGFMTVKWIGHNEDFLVANREVNWWVTGLGVAAVAWAGDFFALIAIFAITGGIYAGMVPYVAVGIGYILYGTFFSKFVRSMGSYTIGEFLEIRFNTKTRLLTTFYLAVAMLLFLPAGSLGVANILNGFVGWPIYVSASAMIGVIALIVLSGGLWGVTVTDMIEAVIGYVTLPIVFIWLVTNVGGLSWLTATVPQPGMHFTFPGGFNLDLGSNSYITWTILWGVMLIYGSPYYWIRAVAARSDKAAKRGFQLGGVAAIFLAFALTLLPLYGYALQPDLFTLNGGPVPPAGAVGVVAGALPLALGVFLVMTIVAANISTYTTTTMGGIASFSKDIYQRLVDRDANPYEMLTPTRVLTVVFIGLGWVLLFFGNVQFYLEVLVTYIGISTVLTLAGVYVRRVTPDAAFAASVTGGITATFWIFARPIATVHQIYPTVLVMVATLAIATPFTRAKYYGQPDWSPSSQQAAADGQGTPVLDEHEERILLFIAAGANRFSDLLDAVPVDGTRVNEVVEQLEQDGYIQRRSYTGAGLFIFELTEEGEHLVETSVDSVTEIDGTTLTEQSVEILLHLENSDEGMFTEEIADALGVASTEATAHINVLERSGWVVMGGALRSKYRVDASRDLPSASERAAD